MGLFVRKDTTISGDGPQFTLGNQQALLIVGLGNPGKEYDGTRHNVGFACVDAYATQQDFPKWSAKKDLKCNLTRATVGDKNIIIIKPDTYMNESGQAVRAVQDYFKISNKSTVVVHDELDLKFGQIRLQIGGSSAGNKGIGSIIQHCGDDFGRIRIGIGNERSAQEDKSEFVLSKFNNGEHGQMTALIREVLSILTEYSSSGTINNETRNFNL